MSEEYNTPTQAWEDFYLEHKDEIIKEFRDDWKKQKMDDPLPENDEDLENWYGDELKEMAKDWYADEVAILNTK